MSSFQRKPPSFRDYSNKNKNFKEELDENGRWKKNTQNNIVSNSDNPLTLSEFIPRDLQKNNTIKQGVSFKEIIKNSDDDSRFSSKNSISQISNQIIKNNDLSENQEKQNTNCKSNDLPETTIGNFKDGLKGYWKKKDDDVSLTHLSGSSIELPKKEDIHNIMNMDMNMKININNSNINRPKRGLPTPLCFQTGNYNIVKNILTIRFPKNINNEIDENLIHHFYHENKGTNDILDLTKAYPNVFFTDHMCFLNHIGSITNSLESRILKTLDGIQYKFITLHSYPFKYIEKISQKYNYLIFHIKSFDETNKLFFEESIFINGMKQSF